MYVGTNAQQVEGAFKVGDDLKTKEGEFLAAIESGDQGRIEKAKMEMTQAMRSHEGFSKMMELIHQMMMKLIDRLRLQ